MADAIRCALTQTHEPLEVIVIDDASSDGTSTVVSTAFAAELADGRLRYECNECNRERSYSRNKGVALASGQYVCFLDHDDLWDREYLASVMEAFARTGCDVVYSFPRTVINEDGKEIRCSSKRISTDNAALIFSSQVGYPSATAFRRAAFPGYIDGCILREDWEIFLRGALAGLQICILDNNLVRIRAHAGRTSRSVKFWSSTLQVYARYQARVPRPYRGLFLFHVADTCLRYGDLPRGWGLSLQALMGGALPDIRMLQRLFTRGLRLDRWLTLAAERRRFSREAAS